MMLRIILSAAFLFSAVTGVIHPAFAADEFKKNNPDGGKYEFARSYLSALSYIKPFPSPEKAVGDIDLMQNYVEHLIKDSARLRIAKNYLKPYLTSRNPLIKKTADMFMTSCIVAIAFNEKEKEIWNQWYAVKSMNLATSGNEQAFIQAQRELNQKRKENNQDIVAASSMMVKVLKSERNMDEKGRLLAITEKERGKLLEQLDSFGKDVLEWGLKPGQNHIQASIAVIREVLEDTIYTTQ